MSSIARWSYTETAEIKPFLEFDDLAQKPVYGEPFLIKCAWQDKAEAKMSPETGEEFVSQRTFSTEDPRAKMGDLIRPVSDLVEGEDWQRVRLVEKFPMSMFGKREKPDFGVVT